MLAATTDDDLARLVGQAVLALELVGDGLAQFGDAAARGVFGEPGLERLDRGILDVLRSIKIRFARAEPDDVLSLGLPLLGLRVDGQGQGGSQRRRAT